MSSCVRAQKGASSRADALRNVLCGAKLLAVISLVLKSLFHSNKHQHQARQRAGISAAEVNAPAQLRWQHVERRGGGSHAPSSSFAGIYIRAFLTSSRSPSSLVPNMQRLHNSTQAQPHASLPPISQMYKPHFPSRNPFPATANLMPSAGHNF
jgi:hypothetical protein